MVFYAVMWQSMCGMNGFVNVGTQRKKSFNDGSKTKIHMDIAIANNVTTIMVVTDGFVINGGKLTTVKIQSVLQFSNAYLHGFHHLTRKFIINGVYFHTTNLMLSHISFI